MQLYILGFVDHPHPAPAEFLDDTVMRDSLVDHAQECYGGKYKQVNESHGVGGVLTGSGMLLKSLGIRQAGFHAFRHFNVALLDSLCVPLKVIQERAGHALTGSFTLDVYG